MTTWAAHLERLDLPVAPDPGGRVVVVSAHPDDEVLAVGAWLAGQVGREIVFVTVTDGEASHPDSPTVTREDLRSLRSVELLDALRALGHERPELRRLGLTDADLPSDRRELVPQLRRLLAGASLILAPSPDDRHGDHDVVGAITREVAPLDARVWHYPVWRWEWMDPEGSEAWTATAAVLPEPPDGRARKAAALRAFRTQLAPLSTDPADAQVVPDSLVQHALHAPEVVTT